MKLFKKKPKIEINKDIHINPTVIYRGGRVRIESDGTPHNTRIYLDDKEIDGVISLHLIGTTHTVMTLHLEIMDLAQFKRPKIAESPVALFPKNDGIIS